MGRKKQYTTSVERQAAYRQRLREETMVVDRQQLERLLAKLDGLHAAIGQAKRAGDHCASQVFHASVDTTLEALTAWFTERAVAAAHVA